VRLLVREALHQEGHNYLGNIAELPYLLTPLLAKSALQQDLLQKLFADFLLDCEREAERLKVEPIEEVDQPPTSKPSSWRANWRWGIAAVLLLAAAYLVIQFLKPPQKLAFIIPDTTVRIGDTVVFQNLSEGFTDADEDFDWELSIANINADFVGSHTIRDYTWVVREREPTLVGQTVRVILSREGLSPYSATVKVQCGNPPIIRELKTPEPPLKVGQAYTIEVLTDPNVRLEWTIDRKQYEATPGNGSDTLHSLTYTFEQAGTFFASFIAYRPDAREDCFVERNDLQFFVGNNKPILSTTALRLDEAKLIVTLADWVWLLMFLAFLVASWAAWKADQQRKKRPERTGKSPAQLEAEHPIHDQAPYYVPYLDRNGLIQVPPDFFRMADVMRRWEESARSNFDALASVQATIRGGGFPQLLEAADTLPGDYLILVARSNARHHQGRLWERLTTFWKQQDAPIEIWYHDGSFRSFWQAEQPGVQGLPQLRRRFPQHRLLLLGTGEGLLNPYDTRSPSLHADLAATLQLWPRRLLLTPAPPAGWSYREKLLYRYTLLHPADTRGILEGLEALDALEEFEPGAYSTHEAAQQARRSTLHDRYRDWSSLQVHRDYLGDDPEAFRWLCGLAVSAVPDWSLTLAIGRALGVSVTHDRLLALTRIPWLAANEDHTDLRLQLIAQLTSAEEQVARLAAADELEAVRDKVADSFADIEWKTNLAVQYFALDPRDEAHKNLIQDLQAAGLLIGSQLQELDFIVRERIKRDDDLPASAYTGLAGWLAAAPVAPFWNKWMKLALAITLLWFTLAILCLTYYISPAKTLADGSHPHFWQVTRPLNDDALRWNNEAVGIGQRMRMAKDYPTWRDMRRDSMPIADSLFSLAKRTRGVYALADSNEIALRYNFAAQRFNYRMVEGQWELMDTALRLQLKDTLSKASTLAWQENADDFAAVNILARNNGMLIVADALHGRGLCYYYNFLENADSTHLCDSARVIYQQILQISYGEYFVALADNMPTNLESLLLQTACQPAITTDTPAPTENMAISGRIVDAQTGQPIAKATLRAAPADRITEAQLRAGRDADIRSTTTDAQGRYTLTNLPQPTQLQRYATATGYAAQSSRASATAQWADIRLQPLAAAGNSEAKAAYEAALAANTITAYNSFLQGPHGSSSYAAEATRRRNALQETADYKEAIATKTLAAYDAYLTKWPNGSKATDIQARKAALSPPPTGKELETIATNMIRVPGGTYTMGCLDGRDTDCYDDEKPQHEVTVSTFSISKYEVTQAQWRAVMGSDPSSNSGCDACPVEQVSWDDIQEFLQKLNAQTGQKYRLPTEAEWEYAARGGQRGKANNYLYSGSNTLGEVAWYSANAKDGKTNGTKKTTRPVGGKKPNELGLYDMSGNVLEWCSDWYLNDYYKNSPQQNPRGPEEDSIRVHRGGGWFFYPLHCRAAYRDAGTPTRRNDIIGFRLAR